MTDRRRPTLLGGFFYPFRGFGFLGRHPKLLAYVAVPVGVNTLLYGVLTWLGVRWYGQLADRYLPAGDAWYWVALHFVLGVLAAVVLFFVMVYTFTLVGNLLLAPFNDLLSEKVEWVYSGRRLDEPFRLGAFARDLVRSLKAEAGRMALYLVGFLALLSLNLFPPVGTAVSGVLTPVYIMFFLGWEYLDYAMERWQFPFSDKRRAVFRNLPALLGFGAASAVLLAIPVAGLLAIPVCVTGGTLLFCDLRDAQRIPSPNGREPKVVGRG